MAARRVGWQRSAALLASPLLETWTMPSNDPRQLLGKLGEDLAASELERRGYSILATRHRTRFGEIDIVAERPAPHPVSQGRREVAFVEVKARKTKKYGSAAESVTPWK